MFCGKTTLSECPRFSSLQQLLSSQSGLQQKWRGVDGAVSLERGVERIKDRRKLSGQLQSTKQHSPSCCGSWCCNRTGSTFCGKTTRSKCPRFSSLQQLLSSQSGLQQKWRGVDGAVSLERGVEAGSRTDENCLGSYNQQSSIHRVAAALGVEKSDWQHVLWQNYTFEVPSFQLSATASQLSVWSPAKNGAVLTVLSVWEEAWSSSKLRCSLVLHFLSSDSHGGEA